jgi:hypothetical protein
MTPHVLVCPFNQDVFSLFQGRTLAVRVGTIDDVPRVAEAVHRSLNNLHCVLFDSNDSLADTHLHETWRSIPIALYVPEMGDFIKVAKKLPVMRNLNLRVYLPLNRIRNYVDFRILSSLGIASAIVFGEKEINWEALSDLMIYALLNRVHHADIHPFHYIASQYDPVTRLDEFSYACFDNPRKYLHLNEAGCVALSEQDLIHDKFISDHVDQIGDINACPLYIDAIHEWKNIFQRAEDCSFCQAWRVCLGKFRKMSDDRAACREFFLDFMETIEQYQSMQKNMIRPWQP